MAACLLLLSLFAGFYLLLVASGRDIKKPVGFLLPSLTTVDGVKLRDLKEGKSHLIFFSLSCKKCVAFLKKIKSNGGEVKYIAIGDSCRKALVDFRDKSHIALPLVADPLGRLFRKFAVTEVPTHLLFYRETIELIE